jgi:putative DNA methylase
VLNDSFEGDERRLIDPDGRYSSDELRQFESSALQMLELLPGASVERTRDVIQINFGDFRYDNIGYADLSDFFYIWLRRSIGSIYPAIFSTLLVPKSQELVATPYRFGGDKQKAKEFFEKGLGKAFSQMRETADSDYPLTVYYAFKQAESEDDDDENGMKSAISSTGWETMLEGLIKAGFTITGTLPMRTEMSNRSIASGTNALASSIVLVCRPRPTDAPSTTRRQFLAALKRELPDALKKLQQGNIAPVDLAQASIGPGMAVFSHYAKVLESDGTPMRVRTALQLINQTLDEFLTEQEGEFDGDTRWALSWFEQHQFDEGKYGDAETLSKAKNTSISGLVNSGILSAKGGRVRLLRRDELPKDWNPKSDSRIPDWEATQHLIRALDQNGESGAALLLAQLGSRGEVARDLAYRLYSLCDRKGWTQEAIAYNSLVISWPEISRLAADEQKQPTAVQGELKF